MTLGDITTRVEQRLDENTASPVTFTAEEIRQATNRGQRYFAAATLCIEREGVLPLTPGQAWYHLLPIFSNFFLPLRVKVTILPSAVGKALFDSAVFDEILFDQVDTTAAQGPYRVAPATLSQFVAVSETWENDISPQPAMYGTIGDLMFITPHPSDITSVFRILYAAVPADLNALGDSPSILTAYHPCLIDWDCFELSLKMGAQYLQNGLNHLNRFLDEVQKAAEFMRARGTALHYDNVPFELSAADRNRLLWKAVADAKRARTVADEKRAREEER